LEKLNRRQFIKNSALYAVSVCTFGFISCSKENENILNNPVTGDCKTTSDILGPFYRAGAPFRSDLTLPDQSGENLIINGKVYSSDCVTLLKDAIVDIWHAGNEGEYDNTSEEFLYRGRFLTGDDGSYQFRTIIPGRYLNGNTFRPSHIHFRVTAPDHIDLVSQIYFKDDPFIETDPWASDPAAELRILNMEGNSEGIKTVQFDIHLIKN
jgi:protocatechuate 3,4-dioxygenase beta subunit